MGTKELAKKVKRLREIEAEAVALSEQAESLKDEIKAELTARGAEKLQAGLFLVRWAKVERSRFDTVAFREAHADLYAQYLRSVEIRRFTVA